MGKRAERCEERVETPREGGLAKGYTPAERVRLEMKLEDLGFKSTMVGTCSGCSEYCHLLGQTLRDSGVCYELYRKKRGNLVEREEADAQLSIIMSRQISRTLELLKNFQ